MCNTMKKLWSHSYPNFDFFVCVTEHGGTLTVIVPWCYKTLSDINIKAQDSKKEHRERERETTSSLQWFYKFPNIMDNFASSFFIFVVERDLGIIFLC